MIKMPGDQVNPNKTDTNSFQSVVRNFRLLLTNSVVQVISPVWLKPAAYAENDSGLLFDPRLDCPLSTLTSTPADPFFVQQLKQFYPLLSDLEFLLTVVGPIIKPSSGSVFASLSALPKFNKLIQSAFSVMNAFDDLYQSVLIFCQFAEIQLQKSYPEFHAFQKVTVEGNIATLFLDMAARVKQLVVTLQNTTQNPTTGLVISEFNKLPSRPMVEVNKVLDIPTPSSPTSNPILNLLQIINSRLDADKLRALTNYLGKSLAILNCIFTKEGFSLSGLITQLWTFDLNELMLHIRAINKIMDTDNLLTERIACYHYLRGLFEIADQQELALGIKPGLIRDLLKPMGVLMNLLNPTIKGKTLPANAAIFPRIKILIEDAKKTHHEAYHQPHVEQEWVTTSIRLFTFSADKNAHLSNTAMTAQQVVLALAQQESLLKQALCMQISALKMLENSYEWLEKKVVLAYQLNRKNYDHVNEDFILVEEHTKEDEFDDDFLLVEEQDNADREPQFYDMQGMHQPIIEFYVALMDCLHSILLHRKLYRVRLLLIISTIQQLVDAPLVKATTKNSLALQNLTQSPVERIEAYLTEVAQWLEKLPAIKGNDPKAIAAEARSMLRVLIDHAQELCILIVQTVKMQQVIENIVQQNIFKRYANRDFDLAQISEQLSEGYSRICAYAVALPTSEAVTELISESAPRSARHLFAEQISQFQKLKAAHEKVEWARDLQLKLYDFFGRIFSPDVLIVKSAKNEEFRFRLNTKVMVGTSHYFYEHINRVLDLVDSLVIISARLMAYAKKPEIKLLEIPMLLPHAITALTCCDKLADQVPEIMLLLEWLELTVNQLKKQGNNDWNSLADHDLLLQLKEIMTQIAQKRPHQNQVVHSRHRKPPVPIEQELKHRRVIPFWKRLITNTDKAKQRIAQLNQTTVACTQIMHDRVTPLHNLFARVSDGLQERSAQEFISSVVTLVAGIEKLSTQGTFGKVLGILECIQIIQKEMTLERVHAFLTTIAPEKKGSEKGPIQKLLIDLNSDVLSLLAMADIAEVQAGLLESSISANLLRLMHYLTPILTMVREDMDNKPIGTPPYFLARVAALISYVNSQIIKAKVVQWGVEKIEFQPVSAAIELQVTLALKQIKQFIFVPLYKSATCREIELTKENIAYALQLDNMIDTHISPVLGNIHRWNSQAGKSLRPFEQAHALQRELIDVRALVNKYKITPSRYVL